MEGDNSNHFQYDMYSHFSLWKSLPNKHRYASFVLLVYCISTALFYFVQRVKTGSVFAVHFPQLDGISNVPDITNPNRTRGRKLKTATSPIALFVAVKSSETKQYELKPVAIQIDSHKGKTLPHNAYLPLLNNNQFAIHTITLLSRSKLSPSL